ncbi:unnamed protein product, partial [Diplocarpon coronariae]
MFSRPLSL